MSIRVTFACGHTGTTSETADTAPRCPCGETQIARVYARPPRFVGACRGPYATATAVEAGTVSVAPGGALRLKQE